jgi:hypothetical protein
MDPASISMPSDLFQWAPTIIDDVPVYTLSPLALAHIRAGATATPLSQQADVSR